VRVLFARLEDHILDVLAQLGNLRPYPVTGNDPGFHALLQRFAHDALSHVGLLSLPYGFVAAKQERSGVAIDEDRHERGDPRIPIAGGRLLHAPLDLLTRIP
jgi:hypothetical protein